MATIQDVAKRAGVSISTVSYVLSGIRPVSDATKQRVHKAMKALDYRPHPHARALASKKSHLLALHIPPTRRGLGETEVNFASTLSQEALRSGYHTILWTEEYNDLESLDEFIHTSLVDGIVLMEVHTHDPRISFLKKSGVPFVIIGRCVEVLDDSNLNWTDIDFEGTLFSGLQYLLEQGHKHVGFINQSRVVFDSEYGPVVRSFQAIERAKKIFAFTELSHYFCEATSLDGYRLTKTILQEHPQTSGLIVMNDRSLAGIYRALNEEKKRIPEDFSIISMVTSERTAEMLYPALTTLEFPAQVLANNAVRQLILQLEGETIMPLHNTLVCPLVKRGSTAPCVH